MLTYALSDDAVETSYLLHMMGQIADGSSVFDVKKFIHVTRVPSEVLVTSHGDKIVHVNVHK